MNNINFLGQSNFPLSSDTMQYLQEMLFLSAKCAELGGETYILSGCVESGLNVSAGVVVINGEILSFSGGAKQATVYVKETRRDVSASGYDFPEVYRTRSCEFGLGTVQYNWADFKHIDTNTALAEKIKGLEDKLGNVQGVPKGVIAMWSGSIDDIPTGWTLCNGTNKTPNLSGQFIVGLNLNDDDYKVIGNKGGSKQVQLTVEQLPKHTHNYGLYERGSSNHDRYSTNNNKDSDNMGTYKTSETGGNMPHENRPPYYVLAYIMKL